MQVSDQVKLNSRNLYFKCLSCFNIVFISGSSRKYNVVTGFNKKKRGIKLDSEAYILKCFLVLLRNIWIRMEQVEIRFCTLHMDDNNYTRRCYHAPQAPKPSSFRSLWQAANGWWWKKKQQRQPLLKLMPWISNQAATALFKSLSISSYAVRIIHPHVKPSSPSD
ncbi:hypothetical protein C4D60_Mb04t30140 [Musa balbisiana]|uniref:Uncharacterized protein n=1 Tax=Musa balbisiana TaxID=52838 RepID=A0A4S8KFP3_MUSBA|nr:hypothetical protein C4D60_Mb04t30140 [Musa balbisiana]